MLNKKLLATLAIATAALASAVYAATATGDATATVATALSVEQTTALSFGTFTSGTSTGTINTAGTASGGVTKISNGNPGVFTITGAQNTAINSISGDTAIILTGGDQSMDATLTYPASGTIVTNSSGVATFNVTGVLNVAANQPARTYSTTYGVTVNY
jgi:hypothetical protein